MDTWLQDIRFGIRSLYKQPAFTAVAVITLALGIGGNTAMFSVVNAVLLRPLPFEEPERLVRVQSRNSFPDMTDWIEQTQTAETFGGYATFVLDLTEGEEAERVQGSAVTGGLFRLLGVSPALGRTLEPEDDQPGGERVALLSDGVWRRRLGGDPDIVGKSLSFSGNPYTVVGVMPAGFQLPLGASEVWVPTRVVMAEASAARGAHMFQAVGRLKHGVSLEQAQADMDNIASRLAELYPEENLNRRFVLLPLREHLVRGARPALLILLGSVGFVLLIACANVANLLLARGATRQREIAVRASLGATQLRLFRQLLTESVLLSVVGGALAVPLAFAIVQGAVALGAGSIPRLDEISVDGRVLSFALGLSLVTGVVFGLVPAAHATVPRLFDSLREGGHSPGASLPAGVRNALVVVEMALAVVLLIGAGLLLRSVYQLQNVDPGFNPDRLLTMDFSLPTSTYREIPKRIVFYRQILEKIGALPGVELVAASTDLPFGSNFVPHNFVVEGRPMDPGTEPEIYYRGISPGYFDTMEIPLLQGRRFTEQDREDAPSVGIINQALARQLFPDEDPIGQRFRWARRETLYWITIVGVAGDVRPFGLDESEQPAVYIPFTQERDWWRTWMHIVARASTDPMSLAAPVKSRVAEVATTIPVANLQSMEDLMADSFVQRRAQLWLLGGFAAVAMTLAAVGIYGVLSFLVVQRTNEIGIRMALGAERRDLLTLVLGQGMVLAVPGLGLGLAGALGLTRVMSSLLYQVSATDPMTFLLIAILLSLVAFAASLIPALRATKVDPLTALRYE
jgi:putative ABC transport system permease protein